jgi:acyl carrier protein
MASWDSGMISAIRTFVVEVLADVSSVHSSEISEPTRLVIDLGLDSIDLLEITQRIEDRFGVRFDDCDVVGATVFNTLGSLMSFLDAQRLSQSWNPPEGTVLHAVPGRTHLIRGDVASRTDVTPPHFGRFSTSPD